MATLQKFKLLATQCAVAGSPTRSPSASPVIHLRRRKTLRMLLNRPERHPGLPSADTRGGGSGSPTKKKTSAAADAASKDARVRRKLKDLFVSSPSPPPPMARAATGSGKREERSGGEGEERVLGLGFSPVRSGGGVVISRGFGVGFAATRRRGGGSLRPMTSPGFRLRLFRKAWRPVLVSIPE